MVQQVESRSVECPASSDRRWQCSKLPFMQDSNSYAQMQYGALLV